MSFCDVTLIWQPIVIFGSAAGEGWARVQLGEKANGNHKSGDESRAQARHARHPLKERAAGMKFPPPSLGLLLDR